MSLEPAVATPLIEELNDSNGVYRRTYKEAGLSPDARLSLGELARGLGSLVLPGHEVMQLKTFGVEQCDIERATSRTHIDHQLYIWPDDPRYQDTVGQQLVKVQSRAGVEHFIAEQLMLPFAIRYNDRRQQFDQPAVVFPDNEYRKIVRNPGGLVAVTKVNTRIANKKRDPEHPRFTRDRDEISRRADSAAAQTPENYIETMKKLDERYIAQHGLIRSLRRQTYVFDSKTGMPVGRYKVKNLDKKRREAEELFAETAETAALNANLTDREVSAVHRARTKELFGMKGSARETDEAWKRQLVTQELFINARRFKLVQSIFACAAQHAVYRKAVAERFFAGRDDAPIKVA
ncbi:MAG TPA: hypothetical protein VF401_02615 [Candidatus Saccharimonadales bacterium]